MTHVIIQERLKLVVSEKEDLEIKTEELKGSLAEYSVSTYCGHCCLFAALEGKYKEHVFSLG